MVGNGACRQRHEASANDSDLHIVMSDAILIPFLGIHPDDIFGNQKPKIINPPYNNLI